MFFAFILAFSSDEDDFEPPPPPPYVSTKRKQKSKVNERKTLIEISKVPSQGQYRCFYVISSRSLLIMPVS